MTTKAKKPAITKKPAAKTKAPITKKGTVMEMLKAPGGTTIDAIVAKLGGSEIAAKSLIGDCKRAGAKIEKVEVEGKPTVFTAA